MKATIVYALISTPEDFYLEENLISLYSLRIHDKSSKVVLLTDEPTACHIKSHCVNIKDYVNELRVVDVPSDYNNTERSRYLKTNLSKFIEGDFLYIDGDTVIADNLDEIESYEGDILQVADGNGKLILEENSRTESLFKMLNWGSCAGRPFFNCGFMYVRNNERTRKLYDQWYCRWLESRQIKNFQDQPPYVRACMDTDMKITQLPDIWNCQISAQGFYCIGEAKVIHPFAPLKNYKFLIYQKKFMEEVRLHGFISQDILTLIQHPKCAINKDILVLPGSEKSYFDSYLHSVYINNKSLFNFLNSLLKIIYQLTHFNGNKFKPFVNARDRWS